MADQASDQGRSQGLVSRSEVVCPCSGGVSFGPLLPSCVRVTSALEKTVDGVTQGEVRSETGKDGLSCQHDDGFACVWSRGTLQGDLLGVRETTCAPLKGPKTLKMARPRHNSGLRGRPYLSHPNHRGFARWHKGPSRSGKSAIGLVKGSHKRMRL